MKDLTQDHSVRGAYAVRRKTQVITNSLPFDYVRAQRKCTGEDTVYIGLQVTLTRTN